MSLHLQCAPDSASCQHVLTQCTCWYTLKVKTRQQACHEVHSSAGCLCCLACLWPTPAGLAAQSEGLRLLVALCLCAELNTLSAQHLGSCTTAGLKSSLVVHTAMWARRGSTALFLHCRAS